MEAIGDAIVLLTGMPIAGGFVVDGTLGRHIAEVAAGLALAALLGLPSLVLTLRASFRRARRGR